MRPNHIAGCICFRCEKWNSQNQPTAGASSRPEGASPEGPAPITHSEGCWAWHPTCAQDRVRKALAYLDEAPDHFKALDVSLVSTALVARLGRILRGMP